jgi:arginine/lysine/ornithine decarboxylase
MPTPLYDALRGYADREPLRFHMPGHKGIIYQPSDLRWMAPIDVTELPETGNLYEAGEPFDSAQALWAELFGFDQCQFLTGGSTMGVHTGLALCCKPGDKVLMDRNCHRSAFNALALLDLEPVYLERPWLGNENLIGPVSPEDVERALEEHPEIKTVCITSPTYAGVLSNTGAIARLVHARGGKLFVDGAHGAHLPFLGLAPFWGADVVAVSAHKTLPAMGQSALLFASGFDPDLVRRTASIFGTSSPSYPMLASLDSVRDWMLRWGTEKYQRVAVRVAELRQSFPSLTDRPYRGFSLDPTRFVLRVKDGPAFVRALRKHGYIPEMEDGGHVVFICTCQDTGKAIPYLASRLEELRDLMGDCPPIPAPPIPEQVFSPRQALFAPSRVRPLEDCEGEIAACQIAPYPPGVPVVAPGERISKKELAYLKKIGYNMLSEVRTVLL